METRKQTVVETFYGHSIEDPYRWLEDARNPEVTAWVAEENQRTDQWFDKEELDQRIEKLKAAEPKVSFKLVEISEDGYIAVTANGEAPSVVCLDKEFEEAQTVFTRYDIEHITPWNVSACPSACRYIAIGAGEDGQNVPVTILMDKTTKKVYKKLDSCWDGVWDCAVPVYYSSHAIYDAQSKKTTLKVLSYHMETGEEKVIYEETGTAGLARLYYAAPTHSVLMEIWNDFTNWRYVEIQPDEKKSLAVNEDALQIAYIGTKDGHHYFISKSLSENGAVITVEVGKTLAEAQIIREGNGDMLERGFVLKNQIYLLGKRNVASVLLKLEEEGEKEIPLPNKIGTAALTSCNGEEALISFECFGCPKRILSFDGEAFQEIFVTEGERYDDLVVEQKWAPSKGDGRMIPYYFVHGKDIKADGQNPVLMYAYGGYNASMTPWYREMVTGIVVGEWVRKGGIYVLVNIRGGSEFGSSWHEEGMGMKKRNCYDDFIGVTEQLIRDQWTKPEKLAINGCSNGGLLMSVLVTMRPDLFGCVIDSVPHTDMIRFALDDNGPRYTQEYGNPMESKEMFEYMLSYSPYHNVRETEYPPTYIQTGECDNNVPPYHGKKFAAHMQELNRSKNPILLRVLAEGGHDRGSGEAYWKTVSEMQLFIEAALGI